jgi:hypothetical protein
MASPIQGVANSLQASKGRVSSAGDRLGAALNAWAQATSEVESAVQEWNSCANTELGDIDANIAEPLRQQIVSVGQQASAHVDQVRESAGQAKRNLANAQGQVISHFDARIRQVENVLQGG